MPCARGRPRPFRINRPSEGLRAPALAGDPGLEAFQPLPPAVQFGHDFLVIGREPIVHTLEPALDNREPPVVLAQASADLIEAPIDRLETRHDLALKLEQGGQYVLSSDRLTG
jgi:hypothetical protein